MRSALVAALFISAALAQSARGDGLIYQLPEDGAQVRYDMEIKVTAGGQEIPVTGSISVSSVGQIVVDNEKCRWIEIKMITKAGEQEQLGISKVLIPEKDLGKGKSAGEHLIRGWIKDADAAEPLEIKDLKAPQALALATFLSAPPKNPGELDKTEIDNPKLGKLSCAGVTGDVEIDGPGGTTIGINVENRLHEKAPFGLVTANWKFELKNNGQVALAGTFKLTLAEINTTALSELPDKK